MPFWLPDYNGVILLKEARRFACEIPQQSGLFHSLSLKWSNLTLKWATVFQIFIFAVVRKIILYDSRADRQTDSRQTDRKRCIWKSHSWSNTFHILILKRLSQLLRWCFGREQDSAGFAWVCRSWQSCINLALPRITVRHLNWLQDTSWLRYSIGWSEG